MNRIARCSRRVENPPAVGATTSQWNQPAPLAFWVSTSMFPLSIVWQSPSCVAVFAWWTNRRHIVSRSGTWLRGGER